MDAGSVLQDDDGWRRGQEAVAGAYETFRGELVGRATALVRDERAAEDLVQDAFLRLHIEVQAGRAPANVRAWLHRVLGNLVTSRGRRSVVAARHAARLVSADIEASTEDIAVRRDRDAHVASVLAGLRPCDREVLVMAASGFSGPEIAVVMGRSQIATRTLLCRARLRLRERVEALERTA